MSDAFQFRTNPSRVSASPGFTWGRSGNAPPGTYLLNDTVPSNKSGRRIFLNGATIIKIFVENEDIPGADIKYEVFEHTGLGTEVSVGSVTLLAAAVTRSDDFTLSLSLTTGKSISVKIADDSPGSAKNPQVGLILTGNL